ncbi:cytokine-dependent hematopoietic cell linker [Carettochelys insculpta]|uniref:cytokine-dependent hematopoietic cell linker n=1 Tax=Carettochelys insculpta TaxID=44489 RepID=UPI003EBAF14F
MRLFRDFFVAPNIMTARFNRKIIVEQATILKNRKLTLPLYRSWPNINAASKLELHQREDRSRHIPGKTSNFNKHFAKVGEEESQHSRFIPNEEQYRYDTVNTSILEARQSSTILPAKPMKEPEYADKWYLGDSASTQLSRNMNITIQHMSSDFPPDLGACRSVSKDSRVPVVEGPAVKQSIKPKDASTEITGKHEKVIESQYPLPPPRPLKTLPKKYQPLPPEPVISSHLSHTRNIFSQAHTFPLSVKNCRHLSVKELNEVPGKVTGASYLYSVLCNLYMRRNNMFFIHEVTDISREVELSFQTRQQKSKYHPAPSPPCTLNTKSFQGSGSRLNIQNCSVLRSPPEKQNSSEYRSQHTYVNLQTQHLKKPVEKDLSKYDWYIRELDRQKAEEALLQEKTDETFLVRDCSTKSSTEPYVLVIYYGNKVYNIKIRFLEDSQQYALGTGLRGDYKFDSVQEIIDFYTHVPITLVDGKDKSGIQREQCYLTHPFKFNRRCFLP